MSNTNNLPVPDFGDEDAAAVQAAQNALQEGRNKPLVVPPTAEVYKSKKNDSTYSRFTEQVTVEKAYRSVTADGGKIDVTVQLRVRQSEVNSGRTFFVHFYIAPTVVGLNEKQVAYREKQRGLMFGLIEALGFKPTEGGITGALQNTCFPEKDSPGAVSPLVGHTVFANICQVDQQAKDKDGKLLKNPDGTSQRDVKDNIDDWTADDSESESE
jgi:hypothetical protein